MSPNTTKAAVEGPGVLEVKVPLFFCIKKGLAAWENGLQTVLPFQAHGNTLKVEKAK